MPTSTVLLLLHVTALQDLTIYRAELRGREENEKQRDIIRARLMPAASSPASSQLVDLISRGKTFFHREKAQPREQRRWGKSLVF